MTDEQRCDSIGAYGSPWAVTPVLDRLAEEGCLFCSAYTPSPVCVSARACMLTGRAASSIGVLNNHHRLQADVAHFLTPEFSRAGYAVASFGKQHYNCSEKAFDHEAGRVLGDRVDYFRYVNDVDCKEAGVVRYPRVDRQWLFAGRYPGGPDDTPEAANVRDALTWLSQRDRGRPFFLRVSLNAPHTPVVAPDPYDRLISPDSIDLPSPEWDVQGPRPVYIDEFFLRFASADRLGAAEIARARQCYYGLAAFVDAQIGNLLAEMRAHGDLDGTVIAMVSDHGCHLGDKGFFQKQSFFEPSVRVPFILSGAGVPRGLIIDQPINAGSLLPTLLSLSGLPVPSGVEFPDLEACLAARRLPEHAVFSEIDFGIWGNYRDGDRYVMVRHGPWKLAVFRDPAEPGRLPADDGLLLFNLDEDPKEQCNLADAGHDDVVRHLLDLVDGWDRSRVLSKPVHVQTHSSG